MLRFFLSLRTALWLFLGLLLFLLYGSLVMPVMKEFEGINTVPLFGWLRQSALGATWWLWGAILILGLLTANTLICSAESIIKKRERQWLSMLSPQVVHIGFLFILLAHLLSSGWSARALVYAGEGTELRLPEGLDIAGARSPILRVGSIEAISDREGYLSDWRAEVAYIEGGSVVKTANLGPNKPSFYRGIGVYLKDIRVIPQGPVAGVGARSPNIVGARSPVVLLELSREPGAPWALAGGILFMAGTAGLIVLKAGRER